MQEKRRTGSKCDGAGPCAGYADEIERAERGRPPSPAAQEAHRDGLLDGVGAEGGGEALDVVAGGGLRDAEQVGDAREFDVVHEQVEDLGLARRERAARGYSAEAVDLYERWGATQKASDVAAGSAAVRTRAKTSPSATMSTG